MTSLKSFGERNFDLTYIRREGAYGIITNSAGDYLVVADEDNNLYLVGGGIEEGETPAVALQREAVEETGCHLTVTKYLGKAEKHWVSSKYPDWSQHNIGHFYEGSIGERITEPQEKEKMCWVSLNYLRKHLFHEHHLYMVECGLKRKR